MSSRALDCLSTLQERLKPLLDELGLEAQLTDDRTPQRICFTSANGGRAHTVAVIIPRREETASADAFKGSYMRYIEYAEVPFGDNNCKYSVFYDDNTSDRFKDSVDETVEYITEWLKRYPIVRTGPTHDDLVEDELVSNTYKRLERRIRAVTNNPISIVRTDGVVSINFAEEYCGEIWSIAFQKRLVVLSVDGQKVNEADSTDHEGIVSMFYDQLKKFNVIDLDDLPYIMGR